MLVERERKEYERESPENNAVSSFKGICIVSARLIKEQKSIKWVQKKENEMNTSETVIKEREIDREEEKERGETLITKKGQKIATDSIDHCIRGCPWG